ncbi:alpha-galactosidase [Paenibacillus eucommiae]|uniref:Alpha-galactosidase n=1 Tax=Paenibacillus eucommiae TaxID=1355755 RepID=A0ABS4ITP4_9BACL|nr:alpha-galactosidase [Paenibacillus eucommiae]MBP1990935.1 alpha-galactosidase [Paenibacillus eucommiae]
MSISSKVIFSDEGKKRFQYGSDLSIYTERFIDGKLLSSGFQDNGVTIYEHSEFVDKPAFDLVIDGESLYYGWEFISFDSTEDESGNAIGSLTLKHSLKSIQLKIITSCCGFGFFRRAMEITNLSDVETVGLTSVVPLKGYIWEMTHNITENLKDATVYPYSVGRFRDVHWSNEGNFDWQDIALNTGTFFNSTQGQSGHGSPFFVLRNNIYGGYMVCQMGWSANWKASFLADYNNDRHSHETKINLNFEIMPVTVSPARLIAPGETIQASEVHFGMSHVDFDTAIQNLHAYLRRSVLKQVGDGLQPVIYNQAGYMVPSLLEPGMSEDGLKREIDIAAEIGAELFMVDAGWYGKNGQTGTDWGNTTGDWYAAEGLPNDLFPVFEYAKEKGLKYGLWVEAESAGSKSKIAAEHPDWFIEKHGKTIDRILDLSKPEVQNFVESEIIRLVEKYDLDMFRLDYNSCSPEGGFNLKGGRNENTHWRQVEAIYGIFDRVGKRFPNLQLENCASGGGRTDIGIVSRFTTTWVSDWFKMPRTVRILNGMSMALPPEYVNRSYGVGMQSSYNGNADTQMHVIMMAHPTLFGVTPSLAEANPAIMKCTKKYIKIYKEFIRTFHRTAKVYHHTPVIPGADGSGWAALEYVSDDQKKAVATVFRLVNAEENVYTLKFRGLKKGMKYQARIEPEGSEFILSGYALSKDGIEIKLDTALTSQMIMLTEYMNEPTQ